VLHLQEVVRGSLDVLSDLVTVSMSIEKCPQDEHVQSALKNSRALLCLFRHRRDSTLDLATMVDIRPPVVKRNSQMLILEGRLQANALIDNSR
jgi:hypothetical protein